MVSRFSACCPIVVRVEAREAEDLSSRNAGLCAGTAGENPSKRPVSIALRFSTSLLLRVEGRGTRAAEFGLKCSRVVICGRSSGAARASETAMAKMAAVE